MKDYEFYRKYVNVPLGDRFEKLTFDHTSPLFNMTLNGVYQEIHNIDDRIRPDIIRKEELLEAVERFLIKKGRP